MHNKTGQRAFNRQYVAV